MFLFVSYEIVLLKYPLQISEEEVVEEDEEDPVDPQDIAKEKCMELPACSKLKDVMDECTERVEGKSRTTETCTQELYDFLICADRCVRFHALSVCHMIVGVGTGQIG